MSWFGLDSLFLGTDLSAEQARSDAADAKLAELNAKSVAAGYMSQDAYNTYQANISRDTSSTGMQVETSVNQEFQAGLKDGLNNVTGTINGTLSGIVGSIWKAIPLSVWLILAVVAFFYFGGGMLIRGKMAKAARS